MIRFTIPIVTKHFLAVKTSLYLFDICVIYIQYRLIVGYIYVVKAFCLPYKVSLM